MTKLTLSSYQKLSVATVLATLFLIFVGGLVRAVGAGLGCPDWPTCFGMWIPPLSAEELPSGFNAEEFNVFHTWLEYVNRLTGVVIGLLITATFLLSFRYWNRDRVITVSAGAAFFLVLLQGWIGGQVVQSGLSEGMITFHMLLAMVIVNVLLFTAFRVSRDRLWLILDSRTRRDLLIVSVTLLVLIVIQMVSGTQVREMIDVFKNAPEPLSRDLWIDQLTGWLYPVHRSFSWLVLLGSLVLWVLNRSRQVGKPLIRLGVVILLLVLLQILGGVGMEWFHIPGILQLIHLVGSAVLIATLFLFILIVWFSRGGTSQD